jgi:PLAT/LH2 domain
MPEYFFLLSKVSIENRRDSYKYLKDLGVRITAQYGDVALVGSCDEKRASTARDTGRFLGVYSREISTANIENLSDVQRNIISIWNYRFSKEYRKVKNDFTNVGKSWTSEGHEPPKAYTKVDPLFFKQELEKYLNKNEKTILREYSGKKKEDRKRSGSRTITGQKEFVQFEKRLREKYKDETLAYYLARIAYELPPAYQQLLLQIPYDIIRGFLVDIFSEPICWKMENEISVGIVFVESSQQSGPKFTTAQRSTICEEILDGHNWLAGYEPRATISWVYNFQFVAIDVANGTGDPDESYWRNPAMGQVNYYGSTYSEDWNGIIDYREDMRSRNYSAHAIVIFVTPYANSWYAYAGSGRITLANKNNWEGWGVATLDAITAHETCHLFGTADEYTGSGTPCSSCGGTFGCYNLPNGNCGACSHPHQPCVMDAFTRRICAYSQGHIGWSDLFIELTTADELWAGTDDDVWLDIGDRTFVLDTPDHDDRERGNVEGYALNYSGVTREQIKRVGIRKGSDGFAGGWKLKRVKLWCNGELICDNDNINKWLEDNDRWWVSDRCGTGDGIVNKIKLEIRTADVAWAGTDDDVRVYMGGSSWYLDNPWHDDFERGQNDIFDLDPGTGLYRSAITNVQIHKSPDGFAGGWKLKGIKIIVNGSQIYNNQSINKWLEDNDRDWFDNI